MVVNNRPDGEEPAAPQGAQIGTACAAEGLAYAAIPIGHAGFSNAQIDALDKLLASATGPTLAYCPSGTRSAPLWARTHGRPRSHVVTRQEPPAGKRCVRQATTRGAPDHQKQK